MMANSFLPEICMPHAMKIRHTGDSAVLHSALIIVQHFGISPARVADSTQRPARAALLGFDPAEESI
jgi:hypothetical protein